MPLDRQHVTAASRIMLPAYVAFFGLLGLNYLTAEQTALQTSAALRFADNVMPLRVWGVMFIVCAAMMLAALITHRRTLYRFALRMCALSILFWAFVIAGAALAGEATPLAAIWPAFVATACAATDRSLAAREV